MFYKDDYSIVMRTFWPESPVVGEGLLRVCEEISSCSSVSVIMQDHIGIKRALKDNNRGKRILVSPVYSLSSSSSGMVVRVIDLVWFALATFLSLFLRRPRVVYVATDPPLLVPFVVMIYCWLTKTKYVYHVQDIHPEATNIVLKLPKFLLCILSKIDSVVVSRAEIVITLTDEMVQSLKSRVSNLGEVKLISNPAAPLPDTLDCWNKYDFSFVGNAGRLQRIDLLIASITEYLVDGGTASFIFAGAGVKSSELTELAQQYPANVSYVGKVPVSQASQITQSSKWAILPIDDEVCRFAFPSKAATYALSNATILVICGAETSVAQWVTVHQLGVHVNPEVNALVDFFNKSEEVLSTEREKVTASQDLKRILSEDTFVSELSAVLTGLR